jgi:ribosomal-protein-alanine N-acetyltransferase
MSMPIKKIPPATIARDLPELSTTRLLLRKMTLADAPDMFAYAQDPVITRYTVWDHHTSQEDAVRFLRCVVKNYDDGVIENWGVVYKQNNRFIGTCGYFTWDPDHYRAEIQYALSREYARKGLMSEAVAEVVRFGFEVMGLNRVEAKCMLDNRASERVMQKAGMCFEGVMREGVFAKGKFHDLKVYAILRQEWEARRR